MLRYYTIVVSLLSMVLLASCKDSYVEPDPDEAGFNYYPLEVNNYWIYDVTHIRHTLIDGIDTNKYQLKELVADTFSDLSGQLNYRLELYSRPNAGVEWPTIPDSVWTIRYNNNTQLIRTENNIPYIVMLSRVRNMKSWNKNAWNTLDKEESFVVGLSKPLDLNSLQFEHTLKVVHNGYLEHGKLVEADSNAVYYRRESEHFAMDVGIVDQVKIDIKYAQKDGLPVFPQQVDAGSTEFYKKLVGYGKM